VQTKKKQNREFWLKLGNDSGSLLLDAAPDAMLVVNQEGLIELANAQAENLFGYSREQLVGESIEILIPHALRIAHNTHRRSFFKDPHARPMGADLQLFAQKSDGSEIPVEISLSPLKTESGLFVISAIRDISERKRTEEKVRTLNRELQDKIADLAATNKELEAFSYSVSHDLRAPLRQIDGFSKILLEQAGEALPASQRDCLQEIRNGARHLGQLVDDLLNFSRLGRQALVIRTVDMNALMRSVISETQRDLSSRLIEWQVGPAPEVNCDSTLMRQVFRNLIANAVKFTRTRQRAVIEVGHTFHQGMDAFFVRDNGVGFNMAFADKLFGVFQRLHLQDEFEGTGVGLATVQRIVLKHGGVVWAEAELDRGAAFFFTLGNLSTSENVRDLQDNAS
jgi:PAS domain S-box-containing protein